MTRVNRDTMFMEIAKIVAERSTCPRKHVGAVIVVKNRIVSVGYNGAPPGMLHCDDIGCKFKGDSSGCVRSIHAEMNAVAFAARQGTPTDDATMYSTCATCANCAVLLVSSGIKRFIFEEEYRIKDGQELLEAAGIEVLKHGTVR